MYNKHPYSLKPLVVRLIALLIIECFVVTSVAPDFHIRSLVGSEEAATRQLIAASIPKAPVTSFCLSPPLLTWKNNEDKTKQTVKVKVLVLDDEPEMREITKETLASPEVAGIETASRMDEALKLLADNPDINFLVVDFRLFNYPKENGAEFCKRAFEAPYNFTGRVVIYSAETDTVRKILLDSPTLRDKFLNGQISVQLKQDPKGAFEIIKAKIVAFARAEEPILPEEEGIKLTESEVPSIGKVDITAEDIGINPDTIERFKDYHVIIADDKFYARDVIRSIVSNFFNNIHEAETAEDAIGLLKRLREQGIGDERIIFLADYEFGTEQTGIKRMNGRDLAHILRLTQPNEEYPEVLGFNGFFFFISGSIISKAEMPGFDRETKDFKPEIKARYGIDYIEKNSENFPVNLMRMVYERLKNPYTLEPEITEVIPKRPLSKPVDISFLNGGVNDLETRMQAGLRALVDLMHKALKEVEDKERLIAIETELSAIGRLFNFGNVDKQAAFNVRVHNYKGRIFAAGVRLDKIQKMINALTPADRNKLDVFIKQSGNLDITRKIADNYMARLLELSEQVGGMEREITFKEFVDKTAGEFLRDFGKYITIETNFREDEYPDLKMPYGLTAIVSFILANAYEQYYTQEREPSFKGKIYFNFNKDEKTLEISIIDEAGGIPDSVLSNIFIKGFSTKGGTGSGLYWARLIINMFNGDIRAENKGNGACFTITLPLNWQDIISEKQRVPQELTDEVLDVLKERSHPQADEIAQTIAREIHTYSAKIAKITTTRETISYELYADDGNRNIRFKMEDMLSSYIQATCTGDISYYRSIIFEKGTTQEDIEKLLLSLLALKKVEKREDIMFTNLPERQAVVLRYDTNGQAQILLRSKENLERENEGITPERRREYHRILRQIGYAIHRIGGTNEALMRERVLRNVKLSDARKAELMNLFGQEVPNEVYGMVHTLTSSSQKLSGFEDDILIVERVEGWRGAISDLVKAFTNHKERYEQEIERLQMGEDEGERYTKRIMGRIVEEGQILLQLLYGHKIKDKEPIDIIAACSDQYFPPRLDKQFHLIVSPDTRLWLKRFFLNNILLNIFRSRTPDEDLYVEVKEKDGWTVFSIRYKGKVDLQTMFEPKKSSDDPWYRGPLILDLVEAVDGRITAENIGENVEIIIRFPLPDDEIRKGI